MIRKGGRTRRGRLAGRFGAIVVAAFAAAVLAGCSQPPVPRDQFYRLDATPVRQLDRPALDGTLVVERLGADGLVSQRPILFSTQENPNRLEQHNYHYWVESPPIMLRDLIVDVLRGAGVAGDVVTDQDRRDAGCRLSGTVRRMEHVAEAGKPSLAVIELELRVARVADAGVILHRTYRAEQRAAGLAMDETVRAFDEALAALLARFVDELAQAPAACPPPVR